MIVIQVEMTRMRKEKNGVLSFVVRFSRCAATATKKDGDRFGSASSLAQIIKCGLGHIASVTGG